MDFTIAKNTIGYILIFTKDTFYFREKKQELLIEKAQIAALKKRSTELEAFLKEVEHELTEYVKLWLEDTLTI